MPAEQDRARPHFTQAITCLGYTDANAAIQWLVDTLGADARHVYDGPDNSVAHAELWFGDACVMMGSLRNNDLPPSSAGQGCVYLILESADEVNALHAHVVAAGARILRALHDSDYGSRDFTCLDPEGNAWSFGTYVPE